MLRLVPGILAIFCCVLLALLNVGAYVRHLRDGDQAGFGLGNLFLIGTFLPAAGAMLQLGAALLVNQRVVEPSASKRRIVAAALILGGLFFVGYGLWWGFLTWGPPDGRADRGQLAIGAYYVITILVFSASVFACVPLVRRDPQFPRWLFGALMGLAVLVTILTAAGIAGTLSQVKAVAIYFFVGFPALVWAAALLSSALALRRQAVSVVRAQDFSADDPAAQSTADR